MANIANKFSENVPGAFYVDRQCIDCDMCRQMAPSIFKRIFSGGANHSYISRQPLTRAEKLAALSAMRACPVEAIGCPSSVEQAEEFGDSASSVGSFNALAIA